MTNVADFTEEQQGRALAAIERFIKEPPENSRVFTITPMIAEQLLTKYNVENRPRKPANIVKYAGHMTGNNWYVTGDTVKFSDARKLRDGQNRLMACIRSGMPFTTHIVFGIDDDSFAFLDQGKNRDASDVLYTAGFRNTSLLAGVVRWAELLSNGKAKQRTTFTPHTILDLLRSKYQDLPEYMQLGQRIADASRQPATVVTAIVYLIHKANPARAADYCRAWERGFMGGEFMPLERQSRKLQELKDASPGRVHDVVRAAVMVKAWNLFVRKQKGRGQTDVSWIMDEDFPEILG